MASNTFERWIGLARMLGFLRSKTTIYPKLIDKPRGRVVLVLSPHPDDDVIGCGATLYKHHLARDNITVVYLTDGRKGDPTSTNEDELVKERKKEAEEAAKIIGVANVIFLDYRDQELRETSEAVRQIVELLEKVEPDIVYLPFFMDNHPDHIATNEIFTASCKNRANEFGCYAYEIWTPLMPNCVVDISDHIQQKINAIRRHKTQLKHIDYVEKIKGLNAYRSITIPNATYAEAYFWCKPQEYIRLFEMKWEDT